MATATTYMGPPRYGKVSPYFQMSTDGDVLIRDIVWDAAKLRKTRTEFGQSEEEDAIAGYISRVNVQIRYQDRSSSKEPWADYKPARMYLTLVSRPQRTGHIKIRGHM